MRIIRQRMAGVGAAILSISLLGTVVFAFHSSPTTQTTSAHPTAPQQQADGTPTPPSSQSATATAPSSPPAPASQSSPQAASPTSPPPSDPSETAMPLTFSAGRIGTAYTSCLYGKLGYTIGDATVSSSQPTAQHFSWQIELSDGTIFTQGTASIPNGNRLWLDFPGTAAHPHLIGTIQGAHDDEKARLVITSPNYSAGDWSDPVPPSSEANCRSGHL